MPTRCAVLVNNDVLGAGMDAIHPVSSFTASLLVAKARLTYRFNVTYGLFLRGSE